jgi:hypothetical protein
MKGLNSRRQRFTRWWTNRIFSIPYIELSTTRFPGRDYDHILIIEGTPNTTIAGTSTSEGSQPSKDAGVPWPEFERGYGFFEPTGALSQRVMTGAAPYLVPARSGDTQGRRLKETIS